MQGFNLYREAKDSYDLLIPQKTEGLILLSLYKKYETHEFTEDQIIDVISKVYKDLGRESNRTEYERDNNIILRLQEFFLWRDDLRKVYRFKKYGADFCKRIDKRLNESYSPAKIKRLFDYLLNELQKTIEQADSDFNQWIEDHFDARHNELAEQIEILDQQVSESVKEFRTKIKDDSVNVIKLIQTIETGLDVIKQQATELRKAFQTTYDIDDILTGILEQQNATQFISNIQKVRSFNDQVRAHLEQVSNRIDKIKPRIREFIYDFNQRDFDRKTELFLKFLMNNSFYSKTENNKKTLEPPKGVLLKDIRDTSLLPRFCIVPLKEIGPKPPVEVSGRTIDLKKRQELIDKTKNKLYEKERIKFWINKAFGKINNEGALYFSPLFFEILREENGNLSIATKTAHQLLKRSLKEKTYHVEILKEEDSDKLFTNISLWKMKIQRV
tara:strand:+ start:49 stop:1377 length:1329 start_codon:yes stop_codon:yes gene_type:complete